MHVLDASAFIQDYHVEHPAATVPAVRDELDDESRYRYEAEVGSGLRIHTPSDDSMQRVQRAADRTGDRDALSETDARLLAAALELEGTVVSDDYAIQNVAGELDLPVETIAREGIEEERNWDYQCAGCGRTFDEHHERCPICGSDLSRKNPA
jgi:UPF0271 protein